MTSSTANLYVGSVIAAGAVLLYTAMPEVSNVNLTCALLASTAFLSVFKLRLPLGYGSSTMTMAYTVDFVALILQEFELALWLGAIAVVLQCTIRVKNRQPIHRAAFSAATVTIAIELAGMVWRGLGGHLADSTLTATLLPLTASVATYYIVNTTLVVGAIAATSQVSLTKAWSPEFWWAAPSYLASAAIAVLAALAIVNGAWIWLPAAAVPLFVCYRFYGNRWSRMAPASISR